LLNPAVDLLRSGRTARLIMHKPMATGIGSCHHLDAAMSNLPKGNSQRKTPSNRDQPCSRPYRGYQHAFSPSKNSASSHEEAAKSALHERPRSQRERPSKCLFLRSVRCFRPCRGYHHAIPRPVRIGHGSVAGQSGQRMLEGETFYPSSTE
jgi:hypothetical protein